MVPNRRPPDFALGGEKPGAMGFVVDPERDRRRISLFTPIASEGLLRK